MAFQLISNANALENWSTIRRPKMNKTEVYEGSLATVEMCKQHKFAHIPTHRRTHTLHPIPNNSLFPFVDLLFCAINWAVFSLWYRISRTHIAHSTTFAYKIIVNNLGIHCWAPLPFFRCEYAWWCFIRHSSIFHLNAFCWRRRPLLLFCTFLY